MKILMTKLGAEEFNRHNVYKVSSRIYWLFPESNPDEDDPYKHYIFCNNGEILYIHLTLDQEENLIEIVE